MTASELLEMFTTNRKPSFLENDNTPSFFLSQKQTEWFLNVAKKECGNTTAVMSYTHNNKSFCFEKLSGKKEYKSAFVTVRLVN